MSDIKGVVPPQNVSAEESLLGSILIEEKILIDIVDIIRPSDFYDPRHKIIYQSVLDLYNKNKPVDLLTVINHLTDKGQIDSVGGPGYISQITSIIPTAAHAQNYAEIVKEKSTRRHLIGAGENIVRLAGDEEADREVPELLELAESEIFKVSQAGQNNDQLVSLESILASSFDRIEELHASGGKLRGVSTGFGDYDKLTAGMHPSDLIILAARPSMGKTTFAMNIAQYVAQHSGKSVLFFSLEMSKEQLVDRMLSEEAAVDSWHIRTGNLSDEEFEKLSHAWGALSEAKMYIDDTPGLNILELKTKARRHAMKNPLGLIVIDYLQLMSSAKKSYGDNRVQEISEISRGLKMVARELGVPVMALSQLSRSVESRPDKRPQLADLRESGSIEQDADLVMFIYREDYYNPETDRQGITDIIIKKHRNGPTGQLELYFDKQRVRFKGLDKGH
ncbi:MAG TPA: replicative DNA helicase [Candidatus Saccharibacteria bacterium]|jgi:replicative DNA helicase|nr:replicative DNA helicase [Candidatus Saccharibacteria bacterium]